ncbi:MAG TPA: hypothetical protein VID72_06835, partial [Ktedonobacterales bacterium]
MPENQDSLLPPRRTTRTRKASAPTGAETSAQASAFLSTPADDSVATESAAPRATGARRSSAAAAVPTAQDDTTSAQPVTQTTSDAPTAPTRRRATRAVTSSEAPSGETPAATPAKPVRRGARSTRAAQAEQAEQSAPAAPLAHEPVPSERQPEPLSAGASYASEAGSEGGETATQTPRRRFDVRARAPYGRATSQPTQAPQDTPTDERIFGQPAAPLANGANGSQGAQHPANRSAQGGATRGAIPYSPGGRGP